MKFCATLVVCMLVATSATGEPALETTTLSEGVHGFVQPTAARFDDANALLVVGEREALLVDAPQGEAALDLLVAEIRRLSPVPLRWIVATHWHTDHTLGMARLLEAFPEASLVSHRWTARDIVERARPSLIEDADALAGAIEAAEQRLVEGVRRDGSPLAEAERPDAEERIERALLRFSALRTSVVERPTVGFTRSLSVDLGGRRVELLHLPGHTDGDVVVWLPQVRLAATGDLLDDLPFGGHGSPATAIASLDALAAMEPERLFPGHGAPRRGLEHLELVR